MTASEPDPTIINVGLGERSYEIRIGPGLIDEAGHHLAPLLHSRGSRVVVITDRHVAGHGHLARLEAALDSAGIPHHATVLPAGEGTKSFRSLESLLETLLEGGIDRRSCLVALGGGVIGDLTGFAAAIALRGIDFIQIPTTLLAMVDSSVGGKTGINTRFGKNLVGAFHQPRMVLADIALLDTLPRRERLAGYAEIVKYGVIGDAGFFGWLETHGPALLDGDRNAAIEAVAQSCMAKARIVASDERETGERALLNMGHTFGHALEAETGFGDSLLHGEAVAIGMVLALRFSERLGHARSGLADRLAAHFHAVGLPHDVRPLGLDPRALLRHMHHDKKAEAGRLTFILARALGEAFIARDVADTDVARFLEDHAADPGREGTGKAGKTGSIGDPASSPPNPDRPPDGAHG